MLDSLFSLLDEVPYKVIYDGFSKFRKRYQIPFDGYVLDENFLFLNYAVSQAKNYDLDVSEVLVGRKRSSKSTEGLWEYYDVCQARDEPFDYKKFVDKYVVYDYSQTSQPEFSRFYLHDEKHLTGDRRRFMSRANVETSVDINFYADNLNINCNLIQNYSDLDTRVIDTATILKFVIRRGQGILFMSRDSIPIIKQDFGMWIFQQNPEMVKNSSVTQNMMRSKPEYVCDYTWNTMERRDTLGNIIWRYPLFDYYKLNKKIWQDKRKASMQMMMTGQKPVKAPITVAELSPSQIAAQQKRDKIKAMWISADTSTPDKERDTRNWIARELHLHTAYIKTVILGQYDNSVAAKAMKANSEQKE
jgi:hypothetical protein